MGEIVQVGDIVIVTTTEDYNGSHENPAIVCYVWGEKMININIIGDCSKELVPFTSCQHRSEINIEENPYGHWETKEEFDLRKHQG